MIMPITQTKIDEQYRQLDVVVCSEPEPISTTLSKCRVRIFYRGFNRNRTFISDDFAQQLINSLPYVPIKGIFNYGKVDYEDHGMDNTDGRIYGIIAANPNFAWEKHIDQDGIEREYACADAILFSALYPEAKIIVGSRQSMEIYSETMEGYWDTWEDGMPYFNFKKGELLGLQVLGQDVEPCFEGAAFYSLAKEVKELVEYVKSFKEQEEKKNMEIKEEVVATPEAVVEEVATENTVALQMEDPVVTEQFEESATIEQVEEPVIITEPVVEQTEDSVVVQENVTTEEIEATTQDFEKATEEVFEKKEEEEESSDEEEDEKKKEEEKAKNSLLETVESLKTEIESLKATQAEYQKKIDEFNSENVRLNNELMDIKNKNAELSEYKLGVETSKKEAVLSKFEEMLTEEQYNSFKEDISKYTESDLEKEIIATIYHTNPNAFAKKEPELIYKDSNKDVVTESGVLGLLNRYKNGGNK